MPTLQSTLAAIDQRWPGARRRATGIVLALAIEAVLFLAILTLGGAPEALRKPVSSLTTIDFAPEKKPDSPEPKPEHAAKPRALPPVPRPPTPNPVPREITPPIPLPPAAVIPMAKAPTPMPTPAATPTNRIRAVIRNDVSGPAAPANLASADSQVVGHMPGGEPLYAARWYREPTPQELRGYFMGVGPGWAVINCKTEPGYRVDQCELVDEWPEGSGMGRGLLAAAWQLQVRPPQVGDRVLVGSWVRIGYKLTAK